MRKDKDQATVLRKAGMSYSEISTRMSVPKSTISAWFKGQNWSNQIAIECATRSRNAAAIRLMVLNTVRGNRLKKIYQDARQDALVDFEELKFHPLFISGLMMYWAHGDKTAKGRVSLSSSDFQVIKIFRLFLENVCGAKKLRAQLLFDPKMAEENSLKTLWTQYSGLKSDIFLKNIKITSKNRSTRQYSGVCNIIVNSAYLKNKILKWIELIAKEIGEEKYLERV
jgi:hypothetical protein